MASTQLERLQRNFDVLTGLFDWVSLQINTVCQPCHMSGRMPEEAYERRTTGKGPTSWERQQRKVECP